MTTLLYRGESVLEAQIEIEGNTARIRYIAPIATDWFADVYPYDALIIAGWTRHKKVEIKS